MSHHWSVQTDNMEQHQMPQQILAGDRQWPPLGCRNCHHRQTQMLPCSILQVSLHLELLHPPNVQHHLLLDLMVIIQQDLVTACKSLSCNLKANKIVENVYYMTVQKSLTHMAILDAHCLGRDHWSSSSSVASTLFAIEMISHSMI